MYVIITEIPISRSLRSFEKKESKYADVIAVVDGSDDVFVTADDIAYAMDNVIYRGIDNDIDGTGQYRDGTGTEQWDSSGDEPF